MSSKLAPVLLAFVLAAGCNRAGQPSSSAAVPANAKQYEVIGQVIDVKPETLRVTINHEDIKGFMPAMQMPYKAHDASVLQGIQAGDLIKATLVVADTDAELTKIEKTGSAPVPKQVEVEATEGAVLQEGDLVPDQPLIDQDGKGRQLASFKGHRVALTFIYLKCPIPEFCPLLNRQFADVQKQVKAAPELKDVQLVSVSFDPKHDTPKELKATATTLGADPKVWTFLTGSQPEIDKLTSRFGVFVETDPQNENDITHTMRTAIIDAQGKLVQVYSGTDWTPAQLVADLKKAPAPAQ